MQRGQQPRATAPDADEVYAELAATWPSFLADVRLPVEEDRDGIVHDLRRTVRCSAPARIAEVSLEDLRASKSCCPNCIPDALAVSGSLGEAVATNTFHLRAALDVTAPYDARAAAAVRVIWGGPSRYLPVPVFRRLRREVLLPLVRTAGGMRRDAGGPSARGPLVAFTAGDMRLGQEENPSLYEAFLAAAAPALVHASTSDGVWLLHDPLRWMPGSATAWPPLGRILVDGVLRDDIDLAACEVFATLADDALAGLGSWEDMTEWWSAAGVLAR